MKSIPLLALLALPLYGQDFPAQHPSPSGLRLPRHQSQRAFDRSLIYRPEPLLRPAREFAPHELGPVVDAGRLEISPELRAEMDRIADPLFNKALIQVEPPAPPAPGTSPAVPVPPAAAPQAVPPPNASPAQPPPVAQPPPAAPAQPAIPKPQMQINPPKLAVGEQAVLSIRVLDAKGIRSFPQAIQVDGLTIEYAGTASQLYSLNGQEVRSAEYQYRVEAIEPGTHKIPGQTLEYRNGQSVTTDPIEVVVTEGQALDDSIMPQAQLSAAKTELWEGEEVAVSVAVLLHGSIQITSQPFPVVKSEGVAVSRFDRNGRTEATEVNGQYWSTWRLPSSMTPIKSGDIAFGPAEVKLEVLMPVGNAPRDPFGGFPSVRRSLNIKSNTLKLKVKPLPAAGRPKEFNGLVGKFQVTAQADGQSGGPLRVSLGDPVAFEVSVTGMGNFDLVNAPGLENGNGLRPFKPKLTMDSRSYGMDQGQKVFAQIIFPETPGAHSVVFTLPYFDPTSGTYLTAKSTPVEMMVTGEPPPPPNEAAASAGGDARDFAGLVKTPVPGEELTDILPNAVEGGRWYSTTATLIPANPLVLHGVPALVVALLLGAGTVRRYRAWVQANRAPANAPRQCTEIATDLKRSGLSLLQFYGYVSEYVHAWQFWRKSSLPTDAGLNPVLQARDHWLYASAADSAAAPVPADEQSRTVSLLTSRLSA